MKVKLAISLSFLVQFSGKSIRLPFESTIAASCSSKREVVVSHSGDSAVRAFPYSSGVFRYSSSVGLLVMKYDVTLNSERFILNSSLSSSPGGIVIA